MDVDVHRADGQGENENAAGVPARHHLIGVGLLQGGGHQLGPDGTAVDEKLLIAPVAAGGRGLGDEAREGEGIPFALHRDHIHGQLAAIDLVDRAQQVAVAGGFEEHFAVLNQAEGHVRMGQRLALDGPRHLGGLDGIPLHKFQPGRGVVEEVPDHDGGAVGAAGGPFVQDPSRLQMEADALGLGGLGQQIDLGHRRDGGQGLAPEAQGADGGQILLGAELAGGVAEKGGLHIGGVDAAAVVRDPEIGHAAVLNLHGDLLGPGVQGVFHQLLGRRGGPLHHLAGGNQIRHMAVQLQNFRHGKLLSDGGATPAA